MFTELPAMDIAEPSGGALAEQHVAPQTDQISQDAAEQPTAAPPAEPASDAGPSGGPPLTATEPDVPAAPEDEEDPLVVAQREQEEREKALAEALDIQPYDDDAMKVRPMLQKTHAGATPLHADP